VLLPDWLRQRARLSPDRLALVAGSDQWTFCELDRRVDQASRRLFALGVRKGERVGLLMRNGVNFAVLVHALSRIGAVLVPLNTRLAPPEIVWQIQDSGAVALIYDQHNSSSALAISDQKLPDLRYACTDTTSAAGHVALSDLPEIDCPLNEDVDLDAPHSIIYTSGTTGKPKGAALTHGNHWWSATASALNLGLHPADKWLACLPMFHVGGLAILLRGVIYGNPVVVHEAFDPLLVNRAIDQDQVTIISLVSAMLQRVIDARNGKPIPPTLRCILLGGGPAPRPLLETCAALHIPVLQTYGMTETASQFATLSPEDALRKLGSAGKPLMPNSLRIESEGVTIPVGEVGEIVVRGPTITPGYIGRENDVVTSTFRDGWFHTGDLGYLDEEGYLYVVARRNDLIISGGENIYPAEVEAVLLDHPAVEEAAVIGVPDARWGQVPVAVIKTRTDITISADDLRSFCLERLARYKVPVDFHFVDSLPRNAAGKLLRTALVADWQTTRS
jgi:O-succinylbenzoic acid--CoA ligase